MMKSIEERKEEYLEVVYQECKKEPRRCWQQKSQNYISLRDFARKSKHFPNKLEETIIKFDLKRALLGGALFLSLHVIITAVSSGMETFRSFGFICFTSAIILITLYNCLKEINPIVKLKMNQQGIWIHTISDWIKWENLISCYIKEDLSGEYPGHFLVLHYYAEQQDIFTTTEIELGGLTLNKEDIAAEIYSRK